MPAPRAYGSTFIDKVQEAMNQKPQETVFTPGTKAGMFSPDDIMSVPTYDSLNLV